MKIFTTRKYVVKKLARQLADLQKKADEFYYRDNPPKRYNNNAAAQILEQTLPVIDLSLKMGICEQVFEEAYKIYDFRNSGREGYTLKDGKIVKEVTHE